MEQMAGQAEAVGTRLIHDMVTAVDLGKRPFVCTGDSGDVYTGDTVIVCTGAQAKWLGLESEQRFMGFGVSACATCDGFFFRGKEVAVIGGGNTRSKRRSTSPITRARSRSSTAATRCGPRKSCRTVCSANDKIEVLWDHVLDEIEGESDPPTVTGIAVRHVRTDAVHLIPLSGVFIAIGHRPNTELFAGQLTMDDEGYIQTMADSTRTNVAGRVRRRRCAGQGVSAGGDRRRHRLHGRAGSREVSCRGRNAGGSRRGREHRAPAPEALPWIGTGYEFFRRSPSTAASTRAGDILELSQSAVSRQIAALEKSLGAVLFHRHSRGRPAA